MYLKRFYKFLKGMDNGINDTPLVDYFVGGCNKWYQSTHFPPKNIIQESFYLNGQGTADKDVTSGLLSLNPLDREGIERYIYDPNNPPREVDGVLGNFPINNDEIDTRDDSLTFTSEPFIEETTYIGSPKLTFYASSSAPDTDWVVRLIIVSQDGTIDNGNAVLLQEYLCARYRNGFDKAELMKEGEIYKFSIEFPYMAYQFKKGDQIRLSICSAADGIFAPNPNTGESIFFGSKPPQIAINTLYYGKNYPSVLTLNKLL